ncbi:hypothetical protein N9933_03375 [bacterium]|nr:hypothetical protein [bacterium]
MNPRNLKYNLLDNTAQVIVFNKNGVIQDSCHSLVDVFSLLGESVFEKFPFVYSIQEELNFSETVQVLSYHAVEFDFKGTEGIFDFHFHPHPVEPNLLVWVFVDHSQHYHFLRDIQKERNMLLIELQKLREDAKK